jgi:hypothetical protein
MAVVLTGVAIVSCWWQAGVTDGRSRGIGVAGACLVYLESKGTLYQADPPDILVARVSPPSICFLPAHKNDAEVCRVSVPIWPLLLVLGIAFIQMGRRHLRAGNAMACARCRYNTAGLATDARCPECGAEQVGPRVESGVDRDSSPPAR